MRLRFPLSVLFLPLAIAAASSPATPADGPDDQRRMVLVELYTSQGCDMCPAAEEILGALAEQDRRVVPIAFHVDYFNDPWKDVFSDPLYSERQMAYHRLYTGPRHPDHGLYYTPMLMIDGEQSVSGRDGAAARAAIRRALAKKPAVSPGVDLAVERDGRSGTATIRVASRSARAEKTPLLLCAVLREDGVVTHVASGENAGKSLVARFPARRTKYEFVELDGKSPATQRFPFEIEPTWDRRHLRLAVFVQDKRTGAVHQAGAGAVPDLRDRSPGAGPGEAGPRGTHRPEGRREGPRVYPEGPVGQGTLARRIPREGEGRPGLLPIGRLVTLLPHATGPVAT